LPGGKTYLEERACRGGRLLKGKVHRPKRKVLKVPCRGKHFILAKKKEGKSGNSDHAC